MALYGYFKKQAPEVPSPNGSLSNSLSPATTAKGSEMLPVSLWHGNSSSKNWTPNISVDMVAPYHGLDSEGRTIHAPRSFDVQRVKLGVV